MYIREKETKCKIPTRTLQITSNAMQKISRQANITEDSRFMVNEKLSVCSNEIKFYEIAFTINKRKEKQNKIKANIFEFYG